MGWPPFRWESCQAGTNPLDPASCLVLQMFPAPSGSEVGALVFSFQSQPDRLYIIQATDNVVGSAWSTVGAEIAGTGETMLLNYGASHNWRFYRVQARPVR